MIQRLGNLWKMSGLDVEKKEDKKILEKLFPNKMATIVETETPLELFPSEDEDGNIN